MFTYTVVNIRNHNSGLAFTILFCHIGVYVAKSISSKKREIASFNIMIITIIVKRLILTIMKKP